MLKTAVFLYFIVLGWTGIVLGHTWIRPYVVAGVWLAVSAAFLILYRPRGRRIRANAVDLEVFVLLMCLLGGTLLAGMNPKTLNYLLAYGFVFGVGYGVVRLALSSPNGYHAGMMGNWIGVLIVCVIGLLEFFLKLNFDSNLSEYLPKIKPDNATELFAGMRLPRVYSLAPEPTILGFYLNTLGVLALGWVSVYRSRKLFLMTLVLISSTYVLAGSAAAFGGLIVGILLLVLRKVFAARMRVYGYWRWFVLVLLLCAVVVMPSIGQWTMLDKLANPETYSGSRFERWVSGLTDIAEAGPLGKGLGFVSSESGGGSYLNWYLTVGVDGGWISALLVLLILGTGFYYIWKSAGPLRDWYLVAFVAGAVHFNAIATFFNPFLWTLLALFFAGESVRGKLRQHAITDSGKFQGDRASMFVQAESSGI